MIKRFRETIGKTNYGRIRSIGFVASVSNERHSKTSPPPDPLEVQITAALEAMIIAGGLHCLNTQNVSAKIEVCVSIHGHHSYRRLTSGETLAGAVEYDTRFHTSIELSLRLPACTWERHLRQWLAMADEAEQVGDVVRKRGIEEVVASMTTARERLRTLLPLQSRI